MATITDFAHPACTAATRPETGLRTPITVAAGDGIGPEIMAATLAVLDAAGAAIAPEPVTLGEAVYRAGETSGVPAEAWASLARTGVLLKGPITTPSGGGWKSVNVTLRKTLGLFANVRPVAAYHPWVKGLHPAMDLVIVRENEEDLYAGIEHRQTDEAVQCLKLVTRAGCERIARYAFAYARAHGRKTVTSMGKENIMKLTDGLFRSVCEQVAAEYPEIAWKHQIIDIGAARIAARPQDYDVVVTLNLYGDIISDIAAEVAGSVGLAPSMNLGSRAAMFEAIHGSAPDIAGMDIANPSGLLLSAVQMLAHLGQGEVAARIHNAWLRTIEDGIHTRDIFRAGTSTRLAGTRAFAEAVCARLGQAPQRLPAAAAARTAVPMPEVAAVAPVAAHKRLVGVDVFVHHRPDEEAVSSLAHRLAAHAGHGWSLAMVTCRGVKVWPGGHAGTTLTDHLRCRFVVPGNGATGLASVLDLLRRVGDSGADIIKTEHLYTFDGAPGYSLGQGQ